MVQICRTGPTWHVRPFQQTESAEGIFDFVFCGVFENSFHLWESFNSVIVGEAEAVVILCRYYRDRSNASCVKVSGDSEPRGRLASLLEHVIHTCCPFIATRVLIRT